MLHRVFTTLRSQLWVLPVKKKKSLLGKVIPFPTCPSATPIIFIFEYLKTKNFTLSGQTPEKIVLCPWLEF